MKPYTPVVLSLTMWLRLLTSVWDGGYQLRSTAAAAMVGGTTALGDDSTVVVERTGAVFAGGRSATMSVPLSK
jgi:hypothetical protein